MIPTILTTLALGIASLSVSGQSLFTSIITGANFVSGSAIVSNLFFLPDGNTTTAPSIYVGTTKILTLTGGTAAPSALIFDSSNNQPACQKYGTRSIDCYQQKTLTDTGACVAGGCATKAYVVASIQKPYTGSGMIKRLEVTCDAQGKQGRIWVNQGATATAATSGSSITNFAGPLINSGAAVVYSTGGLMWKETTPFLNLYAGVDVGTSECLISVESDEVYNP